MSDQSLGEVVRSANSELTSQHEKTEKSEPRSTENRTSAPKVRTSDTQQTDHVKDDDDFGAPKWTKQWKKPTRESLRKLHAYDGAKDLLDPIYKEIEERYDYSGKTQAEYDQYKKRFQPYENILGPLEQSASLRGMSAQTALQQYMSVSNMLASDPDQALLWLAQQVKPRDAQKLVQTLSQQYGVDLSGLVKDQPWIDPAVKSIVEPLQHQIAQQNQMMQQYAAMQFNAAQTQVASALQAFANAQNDDGTPKFPHRQRLDPIMANMVRNGDMRPLEQLYEDAMWQVPELREELLENRARDAEAKAIQDAKHQNASVEEAQRASRNVNGGTKSPKSKKPGDLRELIMEQNRKLTNR